MLNTIGGVALTVVVVVGQRRRSRDSALWRAYAEKLGRDYGIAVRDDVVVQVADYLRWQSSLGTVAAVITTMYLLLTLSDDGFHPLSARGYLSILVLAVAIYGCAIVSGLRSWNRGKGGRVAHLTRPTAWQLFTAIERALLATGAGFAAVAGYWSLWHAEAHGLAALWLLGLLLDGAVGSWALRRVLNRRSHARDDLELGWDDVLRHKEGRNLTGLVVWPPTAIAFLLTTRTAIQSGNLLPFGVVAITALLITRTFRRGRQLWRRPWNGQSPAS
ncbi:MAG: hypothetical protein QOK02_4762 [Mycobacterium sp.]|nr:hypothetical protein [Mycobacterium sp.]